MSDQANESKYNINIHGNAYGLAIGDMASASNIPSSTATEHRTTPFMTPPLPPQGIFGRDDVMTKIFDLLQLKDNKATNVPPIALQGMGGIGKTTLTLALGRLEFIPEVFPDGVLWVALGPTPTIRILQDGWGRALSVDLLPERDENACRDRLRAIFYHRQALLIIDDIWDLIQGQYFMVAGPNCRTLVTTRESPIAYNLATRERTIRVDVLKPEASLALLRRLAPEAVASDEKNAMRLCERLEFLPLALTLAGRLLAIEADIPSRMQRIVSELIEKRDARLHLLQADGRLGLNEEQPVSLQSILGMSVARLDQADQEKFAMLGVFGGEPLTWEINAVAHVWECSVDEAEATVARFIQRGLVEPKIGRYWMHALLADYAQEMMDDFGL